MLGNVNAYFVKLKMIIAYIYTTRKLTLKTIWLIKISLLS